MKFQSCMGGVKVLALVGLMAACAGQRSETESGAQPAPEPGVTLRVENNNWSQMAIYTVVYNTRHRVGTITTSRTETFELPSASIAGTRGVTLLLRPIGGGQELLTDEIMVNPGDEIDLRIENYLPFTAWKVR